jgi:O-antigen ligase
MTSQWAERWIWLLPALLLFSRALADMTVVIIGISFLVLSYRQDQWQWVKTPWFIAALLFWFYLISINLPSSSDPNESLKYVLTFIRWPIFAAALSYWLLTRIEARKSFLFGLIAVSIFVLADTAWQYVFDIDWFGIERIENEQGKRLTGPFRNPVPGTLMLRVWFVALFLLIVWQTKVKTAGAEILFYLTGVLIGLSFMFITGERMALLLFSAGSLCILLALFMTYREYKQTLIVALCFVLMAVFSAMVLDPEMTQRSVLSIGTKLKHFWDSDYGQVFAAAWQVWEQKFWFGHGLHTYQMVCDRMEVLASSAMQCTHPHNLYLQLGAETGITGILLFCYMLIRIYITALKSHLQVSAWLPAALSFAVLSVSFWPITGGISVFNNWIGALVWLGVGWVLAVSVTPMPEQFQQKADSDR